MVEKTLEKCILTDFPAHFSGNMAAADCRVRVLVAGKHMINLVPANEDLNSTGANVQCEYFSCLD